MYQSNISCPYREEPAAGNAYRETYLSDLQALLEARQRQAREERTAFGLRIAGDRETYRRQYRAMLGWPLTEPTPAVRSVREERIFENEDLTVTRVQLELWKKFRFYGIRFTHKGAPRPYVLCQHGGLGTPELCSSFFGSENYNDMTMRILNRGVNVFAPQLLLWSVPEYGEDRFRSTPPAPGNNGTDEMRRRYDKALRQLGGSITALEICCLSAVLDYLETLPSATGKFGMAGLSYGGFYSLHAAAAEPRLQAVLSCALFHDRTTYDWPDMVWQNAAYTFQDAEIGALICPRYLRIEVGREDPLFDWHSAEAEYRRLQRYYAGHEEMLHFHVFEGNHEFSPEDEGVAEFVRAVQAL